MEFRKVLVVASVLGLAAFAQGCGNACDDYADAYEAKASEFDLPSVEDGTDGAEAECTDAAAALAECYTPCLEAAPCGAFDGSDTDGALAYVECIGKC